MSPATYLQSSSNPTLLKEETMKKRVNSVVPTTVDSLLAETVNTLNELFSTSKFYAVRAGTKPEIEEAIKNSGNDFYVTLHFHVSYSYDIQKKSTRDPNLTLHSPMEHRFYASLKFFKNMEKKGKSKKIKVSNAAVNTKFTQHGYTVDAHQLMKTEDPSKYVTRLGDNIKTQLTKTVKEIQLKDQKNQ